MPEVSMTLFDKAAAFAIKAHQDKTRKLGKLPYVIHPFEVATIAATMTNDEHVLSAALLHDTIEDTETTEQDLRLNFGDRVTYLVLMETEEKLADMPRWKSWQERKEKSLKELADCTDRDVKILWLSDKLSNMRSFYRSWKIEGNSFWNKMNQRDPSKASSRTRMHGRNTTHWWRQFSRRYLLMLDFNVSDRLTITLKGRIDTSNAASVEADIMKILADNPGLPVTVDCAALEYISSAGLRVIMKTKKAVRDTCLINVAPPVYEIFETTGFTELMDIRKALRTISVEGCDIIGKGAKGTVYRIDKETIVKTFKDGSDISDIERERKLARTAFVLGIPTAISYDVVKIQGGGYGSVYELLDASNLADELAYGRKTMDEVVQLEVELLKTIHSTEVNPDQIPPFTEKAMKWLEYDKDHLPADKYEKLCSLVQSIPDDNHLIHGDFHMKNIMYQNGECLLIDMDSLSHGNTVYDSTTRSCLGIDTGIYS